MTEVTEQREQWHCDITKNPVGTDTEMIGKPCQCQGCRASAVIEDLRKALTFVRAERDHWHDLHPPSYRVRFPFDIKGN